MIDENPPIPTFINRAALLSREPDERAFLLVGAFMGYFALMEEGINQALGAVLGVKGGQLTIVVRNMGFAEKIRTLRSLVNMFVIGKENKAKFDALANAAAKMGETRNRIAHTPFRGRPREEVVEFLYVKANKKLEFPSLNLTVDEFIQLIDEVNTIDNELREIERHMNFQRIAEHLARSDDPLLAAMMDQMQRQKEDTTE